MADPQLENGHTRIANEILEHLMRIQLSPNQWQVLLCIIRKTYGFQKKVDRIANFQIAEATGLGKTVVSRTIRNLRERNLINRNGKHTGIQKDWERWVKLAEQSTLSVKLAELLTNEKLAEQSTKVSRAANHKTPPPGDPTPLPPGTPPNNKETVQKKIPKIKIPEWIDKNLWDDFLEMRKKKRAPPTDRAIELLIKELGKLKAEGNDPNDVLKQSIMRNYTGVFPVKEANSGAYQSKPGKTPTRYTLPDELRH